MGAASMTCSKLSRRTSSRLAGRHARPGRRRHRRPPRSCAPRRLGSRDRLERDPEDAVGERSVSVGGEMDREPGLSRSAGADEREQSCSTAALVRLPELALAPDERAARMGRFVRYSVFSGGKSLSPSWKSRSGAARSLRRCSPRSRSPSVSASSRVACETSTWPPARLPLFARPCARRNRRRPSSLEEGLTGMDADADANRVGNERLLALASGSRARPEARGEGVGRSVPLRVHLHAAVRRENPAQQASVLASSASAYPSSPSSCSSLVDFSTSVNRNVTVPEGGSRTDEVKRRRPAGPTPRGTARSVANRPTPWPSRSQHAYRRATT